MSGIWGERLRLSIFGESHGASVGIVIDGLPAGEAIDLTRTARDLLRRAPGRSALSTARRETDEAEILGGLFNGCTTGAPLCAVIRNRDARSRDYQSALRPGHADWTALLKYGGFADMRGGGHFSGRLTAPLVFAGSVAAQILERHGLRVYGRVLRIGGETDGEAPRDESVWQSFRDQELPAREDAGARFRQEIENAKAAEDSVGGVIEAAAFGVPGGLGEPFFGSLESVIASLLFSVPAVKGVEFGDGFALAARRGSESNDALCYRDGKIATHTNRQGGILGGISNGDTLIVRAAVKPTPSIARAQQTVDPAVNRTCTLRIGGRHDPCIVPRAVPVIEAALCVSLLDRRLWSDIPAK